MGTGDERQHLPADHPLVGCVEKLWRAHEHFELLQREIKDFARGEVQPTTFREELETDPHDPDRVTLHCIVDTVNEPPLRFATIIGDMVHNLRSSLDHLVYELAFLGTGGMRDLGRVAFPCSRTRQNWNSGHVQGVLLKGVMAKHRAMIYRTQPCYRRQDSASKRAIARRRRSTLSDLDNLWNHDKHRMLQPVAVAAVEIKPTIGNFRNCRPEGMPTLHHGFLGRPLEVNTKVLSVPLRCTGPDPRVDVKFQGSGEVGFRNGIPVREALTHMGDWVDGVLTWFQPEFETPRARKLWGLPRGGWIEADADVRKPRILDRGWLAERA